MTNFETLLFKIKPRLRRKKVRYRKFAGQHGKLFNLYPTDPPKAGTMSQLNMLHNTSRKTHLDTH